MIVMRRHRETHVKLHPWLLAALIASLSPFAILAGIHLFPALKQYELFSLEPADFFPCGFYIKHMLDLNYTLICAALFFYWYPGIYNALRRCPAPPGVRPYVSHVSLIFAVGALVFIVPMLFTLWALAFYGNDIPRGPWGVHEGNHGPWRHVCNLRGLLENIFLIPFGSAALGMLSLLVRPNKGAAIVILGSALVLLLLVWSHGWLVD